MKTAWKRVFLETVAFEKAVHYKKLISLAKAPPDLTSGALTTERIQAMQTAAAGWRCVYAFQRIDDAVLTSLMGLCRERKMLEQMDAMQRGERVNWIEGVTSEERPALHTAMRDIFDRRPFAQETVKKAVLKEHEKLKKFINNHAKQFDEMVVIGIGGSELGPKALYEGLALYRRSNTRVHFIGNVDPDDVTVALQGLDLRRTVVVVISKSGTTLETVTNEAFLRHIYKKKKLNDEKHFISITMPGTPMDDKRKYLECFYVWDYVGGRYSATSMVGGLLLSFAVGYEHFRELLKGAHTMDVVAREKNAKKNLPLLVALIGVWNRNFLAHPTLAIIPYSRMLHRFPAHLQQCDMESNGKHIDRKGRVVPFSTGPVIWGEPGTNAQHSFFQSIHQGTDIVPLELIGCNTMQGGLDFEWHDTTSQQKLLSNLFAQALALAQGKKSDNPNKQFFGNRPSLLLLTEQLTPYALGALLALYEHKIAFQGFLWGINSFDQEGVQLGKVLAEQMIELFQAKKRRKRYTFPLGEALLHYA